MIRRLTNNSGLSFIELLFTISILGVIMISLTPLFINAIEVNKKSESLYKATLLAQGYMENIKATDNITVGEVVENLGDFQVKIEIEEIDTYSDSFYKVIIEIFQGHELLERLEGYKIITQ